VLEKELKSKEWIISSPSFLWLLLFFLIPTLIIFAYTFKPADIYGSTLEGWTLDTLREVLDFNLFKLLWRTIWLSFLSTAICLLIALPIGYQLMSCTSKWRNILLMLIIIPFWSSFLIRIFAWKALLHPEGVLQRTLAMLGIISENTTLLYNSGAVLFVMVYNFLPFAILPICAAAAKFDFNLFEAAIDLGASRLQAFLKIFVPCISKGIATAALMVFIPAVGTYIIPDLVGGSNSEMLGNKIAQKTFVERSLPQASALSAILVCTIFLPMWIIYKSMQIGKPIESEARNRE
jgi:spermidine/putrescine transport system permease protein